MTQPRLMSKDDGLLVRDSGPWAKEKLYYVERYMTIFNGGMKYRWPRRGFIDLMSGPGRCVDRESGMEFPGSPVLALASLPAFTSSVFVEADEDAAAALIARTAADASRRTVLSLDCNAPATIAHVRALVDPSMLTLCFVDNLGLTVTFDTVRALVAGGRPIDLLFTFQVSDLTRNVGSAWDADESARFDAFFGSTEWREIVGRFDRGETGRSDLATALADYYGERLHGIGCTHFAQLHRVMKNTKNAPLYRLIIASRHPKA